MKKVLLILILTACFQQLRAQQFSKPVPGMKLNDGLNGNLFKPQTANPLAPFTSLNPDSARVAAQLVPDAIVVYSNMPVAKVTTSNFDHMPIYNPTANGMHYQLLIKKVEVNPVTAADKTAP
jgi:hypothetical protein